MYVTCIALNEFANAVDKSYSSAGAYCIRVTCVDAQNVFTPARGVGRRRDVASFGWRAILLETTAE